MSAKVCIKCGVEKDINCFSFRGEIVDGVRKRRNTCTECDALRRRKQRAQEKNTFKSLVDYLLEYARYEPNRLVTVTKEHFEAAIGVSCDNFNDVFESACEILESKGLCVDKDINVQKDGLYLIVGDSFGKHTKTAMFGLINTIINDLKVTSVIHVGEALDDDRDVSNLWQDLVAPCIFIAKANELEELHIQASKYGYEVVQNTVTIGDVLVTNQEVIQPYVTKPLSSLDSFVYGKSTVCNCTRHEYVTKNSYENSRFVASPGTLADPFVKKVVRTFSFTDGFKSKMCYTKDFIKYRRMKEVADKYWEYGAVLLLVRNGVTYPEMVRIKKIDNGYVCVIAGVLYSYGVSVSIANTYLTIADAHAPYEDYTAVALSKKVLSSISNKKQSTLVSLGDLVDGRPANPHVGGGIEGDFLAEIRSLSKILKYMATLSTQKYALVGNHFNFYERFLKGLPSFQSIYWEIMASITKDTGFEDLALKEPLVTENIAFWHGSEKFFGATGSTIEKLARNFTQDTVVFGHTHSPTIRFGAYSVPSLCDVDQGYNTVANTNWGLGCAAIYDIGCTSFGELFIFKEAVDGLGCCVGGKFIKMSDEDAFDLYASYESSINLTL